MGEAHGRRLEFRRSGGIVAGNRLETSVDLDDAGDDEAAELAEMLERVDVADLARRSPLRGSAADTYQYDLTVWRSGASEHVTIDQTQVPSELRAVIKRLENRAAEERRGRG